MVVREVSTSFHCPWAGSTDWASLPPCCCINDLDLTSQETAVCKFFTRQQERNLPCPCTGCSRSEAGKDKPRQPGTPGFSHSSWNGKESRVNPDTRCCCLVYSAHTDRDTEKNIESRLTETEDYCSSLETDSDLHFPPILGESQVKSDEQEAGIFPPTLIRTFAQVVSQDASSGAETQKNCGEEAECSPSAELASDEGCSVEDCGRENVDKSDARYASHLEFAVKCGYSESDLDKVIIRRGLDCNKNLLLQELIAHSSRSDERHERESADDMSNGEVPKTVSQDSDGVELPVLTDSEVEDVVEEVKTDEHAENDNEDDNLRHIIIDGSNVAMSHGKNVFSCRGIQIAVDWFRARGHRDITVFVPQWRKEAPRLDSPITDQELLLKLEEEGVVVFTPARRVKGRRVVCYDDRYVLRLAAHTGGVVVSNDNYRDLVKENQEFRAVVEDRLLMYTFVNDRFMPPEDPLGRRGPTLDNFLRKQPSSEHTLQAPCPYGRKCTFGAKCKYSHPERGATPHKMVHELLKEQASRRMQERGAGTSEHGVLPSPGGGKSKLTRTRSVLHNDNVTGETSSVKSSFSQSPQETDKCSDSRSKSPSNCSYGKSSDYLREHRKKLEKDLAMAAMTGSGSTNENAVLCESQESSTANYYKAGLDGFSVLPVQMPPGSPHHVQASPVSSSEGPLISGHLLLAKKLSDEASDSCFFSQEDLTRPQRSMMTSPPLEVNQTHFPSSSNDGCHNNRRSSLPEYHHHRQQHYRRVPSVPQHTNTTQKSSVSKTASCTSNAVSHFPYSHGTMPQPFQNGYPNDQFMLPSAAFPSAHPSRSDMDLQNRFPGPQHHIPGAGDISRAAPCYPPFIPQSSPDSYRGPPVYRSLERAGHDDTSQQQYHTVGQPRAAVHPFHPSPRPQISESSFFSPNTAVPMSSTGPPQWGTGNMYHNQVFPSFHAPQSPIRPPPPPHRSQTVAGGDMSPWQLNSPPPLMTPPLGPPCVDSVNPIAVTDPRYPLYLHLCDTFAQHRVQAVMNKYPDVTDLHQLCICILSEL